MKRVNLYLFALSVVLTATNLSAMDEHNTKSSKVAAIAPAPSRMTDHVGFPTLAEAAKLKSAKVKKPSPLTVSTDASVIAAPHSPHGAPPRHAAGFLPDSPSLHPFDIAFEHTGGALDPIDTVRSDYQPGRLTGLTGGFAPAVISALKTGTSTGGPRNDEKAAKETGISGYVDSKDAALLARGLASHRSTMASGAWGDLYRRCDEDIAKNCRETLRVIRSVMTQAHDAKSGKQAVAEAYAAINGNVPPQSPRSHLGMNPLDRTTDERDQLHRFLDYMLDRESRKADRTALVVVTHTGSEDGDTSDGDTRKESV